MRPRRTEAKPLLDAVLANITPGRSHRLHLNPDEKLALSDPDGLLARQILRALIRARGHAVTPRQPRAEFSLTEYAPKAIARRLGHKLADKRARHLIHRLTDAGVLTRAGSYRQAYKNTDEPSGYRVRLFRIGVRVTARIGELVPALRLKPLSARTGVSRVRAGVPWYLHPLFGTPDGRPPPCHDPRQRVRLERWRERTAG